MLTEHQERHAAALAARPVDADGHPLCACGAILDGPSVDCEDCRGRRHEREIERSMLANNRHAALDHLSARWAWVEDDAAYFGAVKSPKLRGVAARYTLDAGGLLVLGGSGKGKTASVNRALRRLVRAATRRADVPRVVWTTAAALVGARIEQKFGEHEAPLIGKARAAPVLVVDELGFERLDQPFWTDLIDCRYGHGVTIVTSGASLEQLRERYGGATIRKLLEPVDTSVDAGT